ncbi:uncharacterized protein LOC117415310 isoform X1 [Acipenser ruthenus]|uniref:uncharacterized protein LOC117415310 isoform X1 n=1 Tax=Acipenser ruthenus TaxID=7906 RepID=UPI0027425C64|nr:uncharacterized protein LOC117415310 isoform X1 [Acipenser ruthenus]
MIQETPPPPPLPRPPAALASDSSLLPGPPLLPPFQTVVALLLRLALSLVLLLFFSDEERSAGSKQGSPCCEGLCQKDGPIRSSHTLHRSASIAPERLKDFGEEEYLNGDVKSWEMKIVGLPKRLLGDAAEPQKPAEPRPTSAQNPPAFIRFEDISAAAFKIQCGVQKTPCTYSRLSKQYGVELFLKKEHLHYTCSVKERGVLYLLTSLRQDQQKKGVIVASDSNFSMAVAHHASELRIPVFVIMAANVPPSRPKTCREYGAMVISYGSTPRDSQSHAQRLARENGYLYIEEEDSATYLAGLGTMGLEMYEQVPKLDAVILPAGGHCGLLAGTAAALKHLNPRITVIGVEPEDCPLLQQSLKLGYPIKELHSTANRKLYGDLVGPPFGNNAFLLAKKLVDKVITVREEDMLVSMLRFQEYERATIDPEGAIGLAAILAGKLPELQGKRVAIAVCSASMELPLLRQCVDRALALDGRVSKFAVQLGEWPGDTAKLLDLLAREGVRLLDISHEKQFTSSSVFNVQVSCVVESRDRQQTTQLRNVLTERYTTLCWHER